ncbi:MAG TPA: YezD family protein [Verrucomicrobiae bacterium]
MNRDQFNAASADTRQPGNSREGNWLELVRRQVESPRYGVAQIVAQIVVHESHVVQIERTEKLGFDKQAAAEF